MPPRSSQKWPGPGACPDSRGEDRLAGAVNVLMDFHPLLLGQSCNVAGAREVAIRRARERLGPGPGIKLWWAGWVPQDGRDVIRVEISPGDADLDPGADRGPGADPGGAEEPPRAPPQETEHRQHGRHRGRRRRG
jgi:hypothetical protein